MWIFQQGTLPVLFNVNEAQKYKLPNNFSFEYSALYILDIITYTLSTKRVSFGHNVKSYYKSNQKLII